MELPNVHQAQSSSAPRRVRELVVQHTGTLAEARGGGLLAHILLGRVWQFCGLDMLRQDVLWVWLCLVSLVFLRFVLFGKV